MDLNSNYLKKELHELVQRDSAIFDFLQNGSLDGIWYWDLEDPENEWMSPQFWTVLGHDPKEKKHLASEWQDLIHPDDLKVALNNFERHCVDPDHPYDQIVRYRHSNGSTVWVRCRGMAIRDESGKPVRMLGAHTDLTRQKETEEELRENEKYSKIAQKMAKLGHWKLITQTMKVVGSDEFIKIFELNKNEFSLEAFTNVVHPDDLEYDMRHINNGIEKGEPWDIEHRLLLKDGTVKTVRAIGEPVVDKLGNVAEVIGTVQDITNRKQIEENHYLKARIIDASSGAIATCDLEEKMTYANPHFLKLWGFNDPEEFLGKPFTDFWLVDDQYEEIMTTLRTEGMWIGELKAVRNDGSFFDVQISAATIVDSNGNPMALTSSSLDITERKNAEEQIKANLREKETLLQEIHHRVKNNMAVISGLLSLQASNMDDERLTAALVDSQNRIQSMSTIHETLYQSGDLSAVDMDVYLSNLAKSVAQNYSIDNKINLIIGAESISIGAKQASPVGLIVNELITNSYKYAFPDNQEGEIKINLQQIESQIELEYTDDGIGIPKDFDWKNTKSMGLNLVKILVENQLDGSMDLDNTNGTKFTIKFNIET